MPAEDRYVNDDPPQGRFDLLIDGSGQVPHDPETEYVELIQRT
jgi:hypothetical protein